MRGLWLLISLSLGLCGATASAEELDPKLPASVYKARRDKVLQKLGGCAGAIRSYANDRGPDPYFYYLTGLEEPGAVLVLAPRSPLVKQSLNLKPRDEEAEIWTGYREPMSARLRVKYMVDEVRRMRGSVPRAIFKAMRRTRCYARLRSPLTDKNAMTGDVFGKLLEAYEARTEQRWRELEQMRAVHDRDEIRRMDRAIEITGKGHESAILALAPGRTERQVAARIEAAYYQNGATGLAFPSIVGSGPNGAVLHWIKNDRAIEPGDMAVVDIGASFGNYASDITRTYPVSGTFSAEQRKVYEIVLKAQQKTIDAVRPGISLDQLHRIAEKVILDAGYELPHGIGHYVGIEVHDVGDSSAPLEPGMVITVEPGVYIKGKFGVRIEDMVEVTARGGRLMTGALPRTPAEVEAWMARVRGSTSPQASSKNIPKK
jgi:Xaa-Pro aminopeptidase